MFLSFSHTLSSLNSSSHHQSTEAKPSSDTPITKADAAIPLTCTVKEVVAPAENREGVMEREGDEKKVDEELVDDVDGGATSTDLTDWQASSPVCYVQFS